ncbi:branched-chain amino acid ABC transporter substrate-binding protein [Rhizobium sp. BK251]|uniref:branched-chain amino acid ABC transporter substrate-binding protein n=1 Tax=Rhizobium sp. BK251 TaxID=2512125 RepID=UPI00104CF287|nr:branched-chain amino acid ABC transporter substrate-binding protein [Rhizobium sp. BK251]TCL71323.1 branched-chain amino acid transport system substrate-binding protein [Rhizobium sp. BK251]
MIIKSTISTVLGVFLFTTGIARADIVVGVAGPLTGPNAAVGEQFMKGAEKAAAAMNAAGGINGEKIVLSFGDDASDPKQGISVANKFVADGVSFVIGHYNSGVSIPASNVYAENGILEITPGSTNPDFTERGLWNTFRVCGRDDQQGAVAANYIIQKLKGKPLAIIDDKTAYGVGISSEVKKAVNAAGINEVIREGITVGDKDYAVLISKMKAAGVQVIYFGGLYTEGGLIVRQAADQGLKAVLIAGDGITSSEFGQIAGKAAEGTLMTFAPDPRLNPRAREVVDAFRKDGFEPETYTLYAYAALEVLKAGIEHSGSADPQEVADTLKNTNEGIETVLGNLRFDEKGDRRDQDYTMYEWKTDATGAMTYYMIH